MPQTNVIPDWKLTYPNDAPAQKPGGVTVSTALGAHAVPNKPTFAAGTIQSFEAFMEEVAAWDAARTAASEDEPGAVEDEPVEEEEEVDEDDGNGGTVRRKRTVTRTRTTHRTR